MKRHVGIYLAGSIKKGHEKSDDTYWTDEHMAFLRSALSDYELTFLNPAFRTDDLSDQKSVFGRDMVQVFSSNFVFVDARNRRGLGVGAEMMWAKINRIPVLTWAPRNSHYHKDQTTILGKPVQNFVHPFVEGLSDKIALNLEEGAKWIQTVLASPRVAIKGIEDIGEAMQYYKTGQLHKDAPMMEMINSSKELEMRMNRLLPQVAIR
jgi:hypothetical protein